MNVICRLIIILVFTIAISEHFVNAFTNKLYNTIYAEMSKNNNYLTNTDNKLESLQKEQFITLFIELKIKNVYLFTSINGIVSWQYFLILF